MDALRSVVAQPAGNAPLLLYGSLLTHFVRAGVRGEVEQLEVLPIEDPATLLLMREPN